MPPRARRISHPFAFRSLAALAVAAGVTVACGSSSSGPNEADIPGTYFLHSVSGSPVPYTLADSGGARLDLTTGFMLLSPIGEYTLKLTTLATFADSVDTLTNSDYGVWGISGGNLQFLSDAGGSFVANIDSAATRISLDFPTPDTTLVLQFDR